MIPAILAAFALYTDPPHVRGARLAERAAAYQSSIAGTVKRRQKERDRRQASVEAARRAAAARLAAYLEACRAHKCTGNGCSRRGSPHLECDSRGKEDAS